MNQILFSLTYILTWAACGAFAGGLFVINTPMATGLFAGVILLIVLTEISNGTRD